MASGSVQALAQRPANACITLGGWRRENHVLEPLQCSFTVRWSSLSSLATDFGFGLLPLELNERTVQMMVFFRQLGVWTQAVERFRGSETGPANGALASACGGNTCFLVLQGRQLLVGEAVPLEMPITSGSVWPFRGECQIYGLWRFRRER